MCVVPVPVPPDRGGVVTAVAKKGLTLVAVAFAAFYLFTRPEDAADALQGAAEGLRAAFEQIVRFLRALFD
jgi:hypothetical protein